MSTVAEVWRQVIARGTHLAHPAPAVAADERANREHPDTALTSLVNHLFFSPATSQRKCLFFAAAGRETSICSFCERVARRLAEVSGTSVGLVRGASTPIVGLQSQQPTRLVAPAFRYPGAQQIGENVWDVPVERFQAEMGTRVTKGRAALPFDYVIYGSEIGDSVAPLFAKSCGGVVLVLSANQTRREAALRAKEILLAWNVELLGAVLDNRTFPVPASIYRRL